VILGATGRNVAAGMSGGVAYVLDLRVANVNREMVDIEELTAADEAFVLDVVTRHRQETGSTVAAALLADWPAAAARFSMIMPRDYKRVMAEAEQARRAGTGAPDALDSVLQVSRG